MHPQLDLLEQLIRIFGWPALLSGLIWVIRRWDKDHADSKKERQETSIILEKVTQMETNHLVHLQTSIDRVAESNDKAVESLDKIKDATTITSTILQERLPRTRSRRS